MYHIIGSDGKEYGPVSPEQLREWIAQGRANAQTQVRAEGSTTWRPLSDFPEFGVAPIPSAPLPGYAPTMAGNAQQMVNGPAIGLIITAIIGFLAQALGLVLNLAGIGMQGAQMDQMPGTWAVLFSGTVSIISSIVAILFGVVILIGALKMKKLESHGFAMAASILAMIPCISPCCLIGLPIGIWAIVVLLKPEVKNAFH
jgi:hypothetical protein